jgi:hypothetical protein
MIVRSINEIEELLNEALEGSARGRLVARGEARAIIRRAGVLPEDSPHFAATIETDLADHGFAVLDAALELRALDRQHQLLKSAFRSAGKIFESIVRNGDPERVDRGFLRTIAAASYHLASYAAVAYALFPDQDEIGLNLSAAEECLIQLILRNLDGVLAISRTWLEDPANSDAVLVGLLAEGELLRPDFYATAITTGLMRGLACYEFALRTGDEAFLVQALAQLDAGYGLAGETGHVPLWWILRLTRDLVEDLWSSSLHKIVPPSPTSGENSDYENNRRLLIASLTSQSTAQIELWPSQIEAARRAANPEDDLVVALPTSAGKTRIAELAALTCLSLGKRVLIVTPLRALSAQTERSFRAVFAPLGISVSSLYGASGLSAGDANALENDKIVVATPEKLDFALRSDPDVINDVGLIVLDEGHLIGPSEREIRFETLVQRILKRQDANDRRIVCLSAILPEGEQLDDMTNWIRSDAEGDPVRSLWRPTEQRFGTLEWRGDKASLKYDLEEDGPFVSNFLAAVPPLVRDRKARPTDLAEICLMTAWKFASEGKKTLIFVTQASWVEGFAKRALDLVSAGYINPLSVNAAAIQNAVTIGEEWLGADHPAVTCLQLGMAIHHGGLPSPFLREIERLLASGEIQVTAASPTLSQGLNLNAAVLLVPYLVRSGVQIPGEEFANVAGRAGRAFVDTEGLILHVMDGKYSHRRAEWRQLVQSAKVRSLRTGLGQVIDLVVKRLSKRGIGRNQEAYEFLANSREDWLIEADDAEGIPLDDLVSRLDAIIFGLIESLGADADDLPEMLDQALSGSLWDRRMGRVDPGVRRMQLIVLKTRARLIWSSTTAAQRKGYFAMGVGLDTGAEIELISTELETLLDTADVAALQGDLEPLQLSLVELATRLLAIKPFATESGADLPVGWENILRRWVAGEPIAAIGPEYTGLIEDAFVYRLVWAVEAIRTRRVAHGWDGGELNCAGMAASCLDTGLPDFRMAMLVRAGLPSRSASKSVVEEMDPHFLDRSGLRSWLTSETVVERSLNAEWPSVDTASIWTRFRSGLIQQISETWSVQTTTVTLAKDIEFTGLLRVEWGNPAGTFVSTADFKNKSRIIEDIEPLLSGISYARRYEDGSFEVTQIGPN